jgi:host factor-I protein
MNKSSGNLQDLFLNHVRKENIPVTIYLTNSVQLRGLVRGFDPFTILLETPGRPIQLVYKSAMTSVVPMRPVYMRDSSGGSASGDAKPADGESGGGGESDESTEPPTS